MYTCANCAEIFNNQNVAMVHSKKYMHNLIFVPSDTAGKTEFCFMCHYAHMPPIERFGKCTPRHKPGSVRGCPSCRI